MSVDYNLPPPIYGLFGYISHHVLSDQEWDEIEEKYSEKSEDSLSNLYESRLKWIVDNYNTQELEEIKYILTSAILDESCDCNELFGDLTFPIGEQEGNTGLFSDPRFVLQVLYKFIFGEDLESSAA